jgi:hypothetical protein
MAIYNTMLLLWTFNDPKAWGGIESGIGFHVIKQGFSIIFIGLFLWLWYLWKDHKFKPR